MSVFSTKSWMVSTCTAFPFLLNSYISVSISAVSCRNTCSRFLIFASSVSLCIAVFASSCAAGSVTLLNAACIASVIFSALYASRSPFRLIISILTSLVFEILMGKMKGVKKRRADFWGRADAYLWQRTRIGGNALRFFIK